MTCLVCVCAGCCAAEKILTDCKNQIGDLAPLHSGCELLLKGLFAKKDVNETDSGKPEPKAVISGIAIANLSYLAIGGTWPGMAMTHAMRVTAV